MSNPSSLIFSSTEDIEYEEDILKDPYSVRHWWRYLEAKKSARRAVRYIIYERALKEIPGSYKLWFHYLTERVHSVKRKCITDPAYEKVNNIFERALVTMHKMPRIWQEYLNFLIYQKKVTAARHACDRALCAIPITQHDKIWKVYLKFIRQPFIPVETAIRVYRRYLKVEPEGVEEYIQYLLNVRHYDEASIHLARVVNDEGFVSRDGRSNHELWLELCNIIAKHPDQVKSLRVEPIIRGGLRKFTAEVGQLWCALADHFIRLGHFEKARDVYEEGICTVTTARDFSQIFDAYTQFEESTIQAKMETMADPDEMEMAEAAAAVAAAKGKKKKSKKGKKSGYDSEEEDSAQVLNFTDDDDLEMRLARLEYLMDRRPELLSSVLLRQNPHNVHEWHKRVKLFEKDPERVVTTYTEALQIVDPHKALGKPHTLWTSFAKFYESHGDIESARTILEKAVRVNFKTVDELASVWCEYAEMELRHKNTDKALQLMQRATVVPAKKRKTPGEEVTSQERLHKSIKLWSFYVDLEESLGTLTTTRAVYDRIIDLKIATTQMIINYAVFLEENEYFEDAFRAYEKGVNLFDYPQAYDLWTAYLTKFVQRYGARKLERARDLFEQAVEKVPAEFAKTIYLMYAKLEEDYGLARHAMLIYDRATKAVKDEEKHEMFNIYIARAAELFGVTKTREIYEKAIEGLSDIHVRDICIKYAEQERKLGEIDRARAIYIHASQFCDPSTDIAFWKVWNDFEVKHGNEDTFREMLRIKRSVTAAFSTSINVNMTAMAAAAAKQKEQRQQIDLARNQSEREEELSAGMKRKRDSVRNPNIMTNIDGAGMVGTGMPQDAEMAEKGSSAMSSGAGSSKAAVVIAGKKGQVLDENPDEISFDDEKPDVDITEKSVPEAVFGKLGALERMKAKKKE